MTDLSDDRIWLTLFYARLFGQNLTKEQLWRRLLKNEKNKILSKTDFEKKVKTFIDQGLLKIDREKRLFWEPKKSDDDEDEGKKNFFKKWVLAQKSAEIIKKIPFVKGIAVTGSIAGENCQKNDDLDFLIITKKNRVYLGRFFCYLLAMIKQKKRRSNHETDSWCFNLFLDESQLIIPLNKRNLYGASQLNLMKSLWEKEDCLKNFKKENSWLNNWFNEQQVELKITKKEILKEKNQGQENNILKKFGDKAEALMRKIQQNYMSTKITNELIGEKQIFFHPLKRKISSLAELKKEWINELKKAKISNRNDELGNFFQEEIKARLKEKKALLTGSFDLLHQEHVFFIKEAMKKNDQLLIGIESDCRVRKNKGKKRPIYNENERRMRLQNLFPQATVFILPDNFGEKPVRRRLLQQLKIKKMLVASKDEKKALKKKELEEIGIKMELVKTRKNISMSRILKENKLVKEMVFPYDQERIKSGNWKEL